MPASPAAGAPGQKNPSLRERVNAMRNLPPFLRQVWQTSPGLTLASLGLRVIRALLPVAMLYVGKLIIDTALHLSQHDAGFPGVLDRVVMTRATVHRDDLPSPSRDPRVGRAVPRGASRGDRGGIRRDPLPTRC